jgi:hypothetical protein
VSGHSGDARRPFLSEPTPLHGGATGVVLHVDDGANSPVLLIRDVRNGTQIRLDPLELNCLVTWSRKAAPISRGAGPPASSRVLANEFATVRVALDVGGTALMIEDAQADRSVRLDPNELALLAACCHGDLVALMEPMLPADDPARESLRHLVDEGRKRSI